MGLLAPWFLAGIAAVAVPIYVHLLRRHATTPLPFSSLMFFERRIQSSIKHRRLRYLLLLSLRILLLLLLVLLFANPFINRRAANMSNEKLQLLVIDNSFSMRAGTRLQDARALRAAVESLQPGDSHGNFGELARSLRSLAESVATPIELHLFSDMQKSQLPASFNELALPANISLILHPVVKDTVPNWTVESVNVPGQVWDPKKTRVQVVVAGFNTAAATKTVTLLAAGKTLATQSVAVPANGRATVEFQSLDVPYGFTRCEARTDSSDTLSADDSSIFAVERTDPRRVLFVYEAGDSRSPVYFRAALASAADSGFALDTVSTAQAAGLALSKYAFVVLSVVFWVPASFESELLRYVQSGGSVWIALGTSASHSTRIPVFGGNILESRYYSRTNDRFLSVGEADPSYHSVANADHWSGVKFYFAVRVDPGDARVAVRLTDQMPVLLEKKMGEGIVLLFTSGLDNLANDFPLHPIFVPFVEQTARYLSGTENRSGARTVDSFLELRSSKEQSVSVEVVDPDGHRPLSLKEASSAETYQLTRAGFYELQLANGRHDVIGVNPDRRESNLEVIPDETLALGRGDSGGGTTQTASAGQTEEQTKPFSVWWYIMVLVLAAAVAESLVANRHLGVQQQEDS